MLAVFKSIALVVSLGTVAAAAACGTALPVTQDIGLPTHPTVTYSYDGKAESWVENGKAVGLAQGNNSPTPAPANTLIIQLQADTPIKEIIIDEGFVTGGADPILDIDGDPDDVGGGAIRIGTLTMDTVDARRLQIRDTQVVSSNMTNVVAQDNELELNFQTVTVVFVERGASSVLTLKDFRADRVRILGVGGGVDTHLERLTVTRSSFVRTIRIEDTKIDSLILKNVSLEE
ncbi:MAG: hypothetical protein A2147_09065 [Chloroflexi bacterium RBG_16_57_8]|nr:MAG: hypothetical protein A2147_09065 [Chloroflexi bacterium RBG_16_57_8]